MGRSLRCAFVLICSALICSVLHLLPADTCRMIKVSVSRSFAAYAFYVNKAEVYDRGVAKPRVLAVNKDSQGGMAQIAELEATGEWARVGVTWVDDDASLNETFTLCHPGGAAILSERASMRAALVTAEGKLEAIEKLLQVRQALPNKASFT